MDARIQQIRDVIDELARVENGSNDDKEIAYDRELAKIAVMDRTDLLEIAKRAVGKDKKRRLYSPFIFSELHDVPGIEEVFRELLVTSDDNGRSNIIQTIGLRNLASLVPILNDHFVNESDDFCRSRLLITLGRIAHPSSLPIFEHLIRQSNPKDEWILLVAATNYGHDTFDRLVSRVFESSTSKKSHRIMAAWALAKSGDQAAEKFLVEMLDDPATKSKSDGVVTFDPGESLRAAQAIANLHGWDFQWDASYVNIAKERVRDI